MAPQDTAPAQAIQPKWEAALWLCIGGLGGFALCGGLGGVLGGLLGGIFIESAEPGAGLVVGVRDGFIYCGATGALVGIVWSRGRRFNPQTVRKLQRFHSIKRGYWSFLLLSVAFAVSLVGTLLVGSRALVVIHEGKVHLPVLPFSAKHSGQAFGLSHDKDGQEYTYEVNYRELLTHFAELGEGFILMPPIPYNPNENDFREGVTHPAPPSLKNRHLLGTDRTGRDVLARLFYGFRITMLFALVFAMMVYLIGVVVGCIMGYFGGWTDLLGQRAVEVWQNIPFLYMVIIVVAAVSDLPFNLPIWFRILVLLSIMVLFSWTSMTYYMRTSVFREKARDYVAAAQLLGAGPGRIIFNHLLPNTISTLVTFLPFTIAMAITSITALDYLNFGLPKPTPSWGELLQQGVANLEAPWIVLSAFVAMVTVLTLVTFVGEAIREAFDPKKFTTYE